MDLLTWIGEVVTSIFKHGLSLTTLAVAVTALLRVNAVRKIILRRLPKRFRHADGHADKLERIESKLDAISLHLGVDACGVSEIGTPTATSLNRSLPLSQTDNIQKERKPMKTYLKKLGKTKFQAFLVTTITNIILLIGYMKNVQNIQDKIPEWSPIILAVAQFLAGAVYQWAEGKVDAASASSNNGGTTNGNSNELNVPIESSK